MTTPIQSPFLHAVEQALAAAGQLQGISQIMPVGLQRALAELQQQYDKLNNISRAAYYSEDETNRLDWNIAKVALRQASKDVMAARGMQQEPSWMRPAIQIAEDRAKVPAPQASAPSSNDDFRLAYSATQMERRDGAGFWNVTAGWVRLEDASRLSAVLDDQSMTIATLRKGAGSADVKLVDAAQAEALEEDYLERVDGLAIARPR
ncbi:hypothetical protein [Pseudoxanthomonas kaohsiungensis]|uniref:Uncharacterized protein n=1 Tax=Pseudoxanthomonas kaohsiungensis TaxID=283923 RepID=A0ABW3LY75_9GAMM|nr:hypothetical protein [Pseudoxanthomonas kaohsiungensis]